MLYVLVHFLAVDYDANPIVMYMTTECSARDSNPATATRMAQQSGALSSTPFRLLIVLSRQITELATCL